MTYTKSREPERERALIEPDDDSQRAAESTRSPARGLGISVLITHSRLLLADGLSEIVATQDDMRVVAVTTSSASLLEEARRTHDAVVLLDADIAAAEPEILEQLAARKGIDVVLVMSRPDDMRILAALRIGVRGVILESMGARLLLGCIRKVSAGGEWIEQTSSQRLLHRFALQDPSDRRKRLTEREIEVVQGIARGLTNEEIGRELFIQEATVKTHVHHVYRKLGLKSRVSVSTYARAHGLA